MNKFIVIILLHITVNSFGQTAKEYFEKGILKHDQQDYQGALKEYNQAIKADKHYTLAYFNRGSVKLGLNDLKGAQEDFSKAIELDQAFIKAYYSRATAYVKQEKYGEALSDLNQVIEMNEAFPNALTLRGQIFFAMQDKEACCKDFQRAKEIGDSAADKYLTKYCGNKPQPGESLSLHWPENENWKLANTQQNDQITLMEFLRNNENFDNWTEIGSMQSIRNVTGIPMDKAMSLMYDQAKQTCPKAKLTLIEKDENTEYPWIIFTIECDKFKDDQTAESQVWYIIQGKTALYTAFRAIKSGTIPEATKQKWIEFFKKSKIVYTDDK